MDSALRGGLRASPSDRPAQAPCGVGCLQRPSREHERPTPRLRVRPFPATCDPAGTSASADFSTPTFAPTPVAVPSLPAYTLTFIAPSRTPAILPATKTSTPPASPNPIT